MMRLRNSRTNPTTTESLFKEQNGRIVIELEGELCCKELKFAIKLLHFGHNNNWHRRVKIVQNLRLKIE